ncbi:MAG: hypothetical protein ACRD29_07390 [Acidimicrobiales bacterium]
MTDSSGGASAAQPVSWGGVRYRHRWWKRDTNQKILVAVLIGVVSVTGAVMTWRAALLDEQATDHDRLAVAETVLQEGNEVDVDTRLRGEQEAFAEYRQHLAQADELEEEAGRLDAQDPLTAQQLRDEATSLREIADRLAGFTFSLAYVTEDDDGELSFAAGQRRDDLERQNEAAVRANPSQTRAEAIELRNRSQRLVGWIIPLVGAIVVLTVAQITRRPTVRPALVGCAMAIYLVSAIVAFVGAW